MQLRTSFLILWIFHLISNVGFAQTSRNFDSLRKGPSRLKQQSLPPDRVPEKLMPAKAPMDFGLESTYLTDPNSRANLINRMQNLRNVVNLGTEANRPKAEVLINELQEQLKNTSNIELKKDLNNLLIATLVTVKHPDDRFDKVHLWSYRRLDTSEENWGPQITVTPGELLFIPVLNLLNAEELENVSIPFPIRDVPSGSGNDGFDNAPKDFDVTNLHTHGLNVSPQWPSDDVFRQVRPYQLKFFVYYIPPEHPTGTFFYHPHHHGAVATQVAGGMAGALIVRDKEGTTLRGLDRLGKKYGWSEKEQVLMFQQLSFYSRPSIPDGTPVDLFSRPDFFAMKDRGVWTNDQLGRLRNSDRPRLRALAHVIDSSGDVEFQGVQTWVSGKYQPQLGDSMQMGEIRRFRLIHAGVEENVDFSIRRPLDDKNWEELEYQVIARDGLPLPEPYLVPGAASDPRKLVISPGNRADILVQAPKGLTEAKTYNIYSKFDASAPDDPEKTILVATLKIDPAIYPHTAQLLTPADLKEVFESETEHNVPQRPTVTSSCPPTRFKLGFRDAHIDNDGTFTPGVFDLNGEAFPGDQLAFRMESPATLNFSVKKTTEGNDHHPLHIHVNPFLVPAATSDAARTLRADRGLPFSEFWADTLLVYEDSPVTVTMPFHNWTGLAVSHCHILDHEDGGMMNTIRIDPVTGGIPVLPIADVFKMERMPSPVSDKPKLEWPKVKPKNGSNPIVYVFMPNTPEGSCPHCAQSVAAVAKIRRMAKDLPFQIIAINSGDGSNLPSIDALGLEDGDTLYSNVSLEAFESVGLIDNTPAADTGTGAITFPEAFKPGTREMVQKSDLMHGLFITSPNGMVVSARRAFIAFDEAEQIVAEIRFAAAANSESTKASLKTMAESNVKNPTDKIRKQSAERFLKHLQSYETSSK